MSVKYYRKPEPGTKVRLGNGIDIQFSTNDGVTGYYATNQTYVADEFARFMAENRYALTEISEAQHIAEFREKKNPSTPFRPGYREEIGAGGRLINQSAAVPSPVAAVEPAAAPSPTSAAIETPAAPEPSKEFKPTTGKRHRRT